MRLVYKASPGAGALVPEDLEEDAELEEAEELKKGRPLPLGPPPSPNRDPYPYAGQLDYGGLRILVENPAGSIRRGKDASKPWSQKMTAHYGEIAGTIGADGDPVDVFVGPQADAPIAYVVHSKIPGTEVYDEDKVVVGCPSSAAAEQLFRANYGRPGFHGGVTAWPLVELVAYLADPDHKGKRLDRPRRVMRIMLGKAIRGGALLWLLKAVPAGFTPIPGSKQGGYHRSKAGGGYDYWYPNGSKNQSAETAPVPPGKTRLWRASDKHDAAHGANFARNREDAEAYMDNPGFGGGTLHHADVEDEYRLTVHSTNDARAAVVEALEDHGIPDDAERGFKRLIEDDEMSLKEAVKEWFSGDHGYNYPHDIVADSSWVRKLLGKSYEWVTHPDTFPENAETWTYIGSNAPSMTAVNNRKGRRAK